jgi:hypothetical protein
MWVANTSHPVGLNSRSLAGSFIVQHRHGPIITYALRREYDGGSRLAKGGQQKMYIRAYAGDSRLNVTYSRTSFTQVTAHFELVRKSLLRAR